MVKTLLMRVLTTIVIILLSSLFGKAQSAKRDT